MYAVAEKVKDYEKAWSYLEIAHAREKLAREDEMRDSSQSMDSRQQAQQIISVFQPGFWPVPPVGSSTQTPVFIVG
jgi:hypothetical protein